MRVVEISPVFNEIAHLQAKVALYGSDIELHTIEADITFQGDPKPLLPVGWPTVARYVADLRRVEDDSWAREFAQRDQLAMVLDGLPDDTLVLSTDADEIVDPSALSAIAQATLKGPVALGMRLFYYGFNWEGGAWIHPKAFRLGDLPESLSALRNDMGRPVVDNAGWHCTWWGDDAERTTKIKAYTHTEHNTLDGIARISEAARHGIGPNGEVLRPSSSDGLPRALVEALG